MGLLQFFMWVVLMFFIFMLFDWLAGIDEALDRNPFTLNKRNSLLFSGMKFRKELK